MHNNQEILDAAFAELNSTEVVERVSDAVFKREREYVDVWDVRTQMTVSDVSEELSLRMAFPAAFPYQMPDVYYFDKKYDYFPHIGYEDRKLCLYEDGVSFPTGSPIDIIKDNIRRAKILIISGVKAVNADDYKKEILSYWLEKYDNEIFVDDSLLFWGSVPTRSCILNIWEYYKPVLGKSNSKDYPFKLIVPEDFENLDLERLLSCRHDVKKGKCYFVNNIMLPDKPPFCCNMNKFMSWISDDMDRKTLIRLINENHGALCLFPLMDSGIIAGVDIGSISFSKKGFRTGIKTAYKAYTEFEHKNKLLQRVLSYPYSRDKVAQRTKGELMESRKILIAGLGSVGSNLCHFLSEHNNTSFLLVDNQSLTIDNIGRHFLGFQYVGNNKALAMCDSIKNVRPEVEVKPICSKLEQYCSFDKNDVLSQSAIFLCTGDQMSEHFIIDKVNSGYISIPVFILWLEPFAIAGHLVYINPLDKKGYKTVFDNDGMYHFNLISPEEYSDNHNKFIKRDAGCNGQYTLYSGNDVILYLSAIYPIIEDLLDCPTESKVFRWIGNKNIATQRSIRLTSAEVPEKGRVQEFAL